MTVRNAVYAIRRKLGLGTRQEMGVWRRVAASWTTTN